MDAFDIAVVGAGPAGSACALAAARAGLNVALFEARPERTDKPCGEGVMPPGVDVLRELGLDDLLASGHEFSKLRYVVSGGEPLEIALPRAGLSLERPRLMQALHSAVRRTPDPSALGQETRHAATQRAGPRMSIAHNVACITGRVATERIRSGGRTVGFSIRSESASMRARVLVCADGLDGKSAPWLRADRNALARSALAGRLGLRARYEAKPPLDAVEVHFGRSIEVYLTPLSEGRINVAVLFGERAAVGGGLEALLRRAFSEHPSAADKLGRCITEPEARVLGYPVPSRVADEGAFLTGDAGGGIDPILGCGVTVALESGILAARAARAIVDGDDRGSVERAYVERFKSLTRRRRALATFLLALSKRPALARATFGVARRFPSLTASLVSIAAGGHDATHAPLPGPLARGDEHAPAGERSESGSRSGAGTEIMTSRPAS